MASKKMFSPQIVCSDAFCDMSHAAQLLYFKLNFAADDDGFVGNPRRVMRADSFDDDNLDELITRKFVLVLKTETISVLLIKHWKMHNAIPKDRYKPSTYHDLLRFVYYDENKAYSLNSGDGHVPVLHDADIMERRCLQNVDISEPQVRLGKDRLVQDRSNNNSFISFIEKENKEKEETDFTNNAEARAERIAHFAKMADVFSTRGWDTDGPYRLASNEGISPSEIDSAREVRNANTL